MARPEWLRTFLAIYRAGSVTEAARLRGLSQPATSQQLAGLERAIGTALFVRTPSGVVATERGRELYGEVAASLDQLETVLAGLDVGRVATQSPALRIGCSAEYFSTEVVGRIATSGLRVVARFADDGALLSDLERGELDVAITSTTPSRRAFGLAPIGEKRFLLVGAPDRTPQAAMSSTKALGDWLVDIPWAAYSLEFPITRRFWQTQLGRPFGADLRVVAPDLRAVLSAVERGIGVSILPSFICADALASRRVVEIYPVSALIPPEPWFCCFRQGEDDRPSIAQLLAMFG
jgi:DNA-binding transcriptional LysR family regulator